MLPMKVVNIFLENYWGGCKMIKGLELFQIIQFCYTIAVTLYVIPKYIYHLKKKTLVLFPVLLVVSSVTAGVIILIDFYEFYIFHNYYEEINGGVLGWIISSSICFVIYNFCYWLMATLYIDVKQETIIVHSVFFSKMKIEKKDVVFSESYYCFIPREFNMNEILLITLKDGRKYKLGFDAFTHAGNDNLLLKWFEKAKSLSDEKKLKELIKAKEYKSLTFKIFWLLCEESCWKSQRGLYPLLLL